MRNTYSPEFKAKMVREVLREDRTLSQVAAAHGLHPNLVSQWRDQALAGMSSLFSCCSVDLPSTQGVIVLRIS